MQNSPGRANDFRPSPIFGWGCGSLIASAVIGAIAWYIADSLNPCHCEGDPDAEFSSLMNTFPAALITFLLTQLLFTLLLIRTHKKNRR